MGQYSNVEKENYLAQLTLNGGNIRKTARDTGVSPKTLRKWRGEEEPNPADPWARYRVKKKQRLIDDAFAGAAIVLEGILLGASAIVEKVKDGKKTLTAGELRYLSLVFGILTDKAMAIAASSSGDDHSQIERLAAAIEAYSETAEDQSVQFPERRNLETRHLGSPDDREDVQDVD